MSEVSVNERHVLYHLSTLDVAVTINPLAAVYGLALLLDTRPSREDDQSRNAKSIQGRVSKRSNLCRASVHRTGTWNSVQAACQKDHSSLRLHCLAVRREALVSLRAYRGEKCQRGCWGTN